ncbi:MAG: 6-carboxytetrahydropterin synthase [Methanomassiliicoccales archaeon]|nr:6-carboxytetrahydropterin synthase [Methanomassiliicoccales archaeon]
MRLEIDGEFAGIRFSACHFIAGHQKCGRLHGHTYIVSLKLHGEMGKDGMIMDFIPLKRELRAIAEQLDHRVLIPANSKKITISMGEEVYIKAEGKKYALPKEDVVMLPTEESSAEELSQFILTKVIELVDFPPNVKEVEVGVHEELGQSAWVSKKLGVRK